MKGSKKKRILNATIINWKIKSLRINSDFTKQIADKPQRENRRRSSVLCKFIFEPFYNNKNDHSINNFLVQIPTKIAQRNYTGKKLKVIFLFLNFLQNYITMDL